MSRDTHLPQCPNMAEYRYAWGNKIMHACHKHTNAMHKISEVIGRQLIAEVDFDGLGVLQCEHRDDLPDSIKGGDYGQTNEPK